MLQHLLSAAFRSFWRKRTADRQQAQVSIFIERALEAQRSGDTAAAEAALRQGVALYPTAASPHAFLAELLRIAGRDAEACQAYECALDIDPQQLELRFNYAALLKRLGDHANADRLYGELTEERPDWAPPYVNRGVLAFEQSEWEKSYTLLQRAVALAPEMVQARAVLGMAAMHLGLMTEAIRHCEAALRIDAHNALAAKTLAVVYCRLGETERLRATVHAHSTSDTADGAAIALALALPSIYDSREEIAQVRARLAEDVERLTQSTLCVQDPVTEVDATAFYLAYQGENDRQLHERIAALHLKACPGLAYTAPHCRASRPRSPGRLRIGIASSFLYEHSIGRVIGGLVARLDRRRFSVHLYACQTRSDATARALERDADEWEVLPRSLRSARERLAQSGLDLLLYPDIGPDPFTYFLAFARLAPVQCTTWGHPVTSGIPTMDYFLSTDYFELEHADAHYSERLIRLKDVAFPGYYYRPQMPAPSSSPSLGFGRGRRVYFCAQTLYKFHPDLDNVLAEILRRDAGGEIVITHDAEVDAYRLPRLQARLQRTAGDVYDRIVFLPKAPGREGYVQRLQTCDVVLDTMHYGGANTSLEAISAGALVVTLPSQFNRGRHTYGFFRKMRFTETVAHTPYDYVDLAVRIATQADFRAHLKAMQAERADSLYEDQAAIDQMGEFFERAVSGAVET